MSDKPTERFSRTVKHYIRYRPGYPEALADFMQKELGLAAGTTITDLGSGTGKLAALLLGHGYRVYGVEPNTPMRQAAEQLLSENPNFTSVKGTAENTGLQPKSADAITAAQAFHWFDIERAGAECRRILKPEGRVLLIWNKRIDDRSPFMQAYEDFLQEYATDLSRVNLRHISHPHFRAFFGHSQYQLATFEHFQPLDEAGVIGRYLSCSYAFGEKHPRHEEALRELRSIYKATKEERGVKMWYRTEVYYGPLE